MLSCSAGGCGGGSAAGAAAPACGRRRASAPPAAPAPPLWTSAHVSAAGALQLLAVLLLVLGSGAQLACAQGAADRRDGDFGGRGTPNPLPCLCTDVDARESFISVVPYSCWEQYKFGSCNQSFIMDAIKEVPEGYCQISCGRCPCCPSLAAAAAGAGLSEFLWAMNRSTTHIEDLAQPGLMATLLAPDDSAMAALFDKLGGKARILAEEGVRAKLASIMAAHVVRPVPGFEAVSSAFLTPGSVLQTFRNGSTVTVAPSSSPGANIKLEAGGSSAEVTRKDIYACKGYIQVLNWFLLPAGERLA